jgi:hypothetical protein
MPRDIITIRRRGGFFISPPPTLVTLDAVGTVFGVSGAGPITNTSLTIGAGNALVVVLAFGGATPTGLAMTWGAQPLTQLITQVNTSARIDLWSLLNPTPGAQTLTLSWSSGAPGFCSAFPVSFKGVTSFLNSSGQSFGGGGGTINTSSAINHLVLAAGCTTSTWVSTPPTSLFIDNAVSGGAASYIPGAPSVGATFSTGTNSAVVATDMSP